VPHEFRARLPHSRQQVPFLSRLSFTSLFRKHWQLVHSRLLRKVDEAVEGCAVTVPPSLLKEERLPAFAAEATSAEQEAGVSRRVLVDFLEELAGQFSRNPGAGCFVTVSARESRSFPNRSWMGAMP
jgi:hypothetical protein